MIEVRIVLAVDGAAQKILRELVDALRTSGAKIEQQRESLPGRLSMADEPRATAATAEMNQKLPPAIVPLTRKQLRQEIDKTMAALGKKGATLIGEMLRDKFKVSRPIDLPEHVLGKAGAALAQLREEHSK